MTRNRMSVLVAVAVAAAGPAGCGGGGEADQGAQSTPPATTQAGAASQTVAIGASEFKFSPATVRVKPGEVTFKLSNTGGAPHALEIEGQGIEEETDTVEPGASATLKVTLSKPGTYEFYCPVADHKQRGMTGELTVG